MSEVIKAKKFPNDFSKFDFVPGSYMILEKGPEDVFIVLPCGDNFRPDGRWQVKNADDETKITITPSINCGGKPWHGYLTNGEFK